MNIPLLQGYVAIVIVLTASFYAQLSRGLFKISTVTKRED
jgi:hypothetical protein